MKKVFALLFAFVALSCASHAHAARPLDSGATTGLGDDSISQSLAEEFAKCSAFSEIAAGCVRNSSQEQREKTAARYEDVAKRFYRGSYMLAGQDFTRTRIRFHATSIRRNAGNACEGFPKLEQQYRKRCDDTFKRLPRNLQ